MAELFNALHIHIMNLDSSVKQDILKLHIAYKIGSTHCVDIYLTEGTLNLILNTDIDETVDPKRLCKDISDWRGTGNTQAIISSLSELQDAMALIKQAFKQHY